jgi:hypothetical protein
MFTAEAVVKKPMNKVESAKTSLSKVPGIASMVRSKTEMH